ncbi:S8 family serine peptidase [Belliella sp. R4-6]|uniref:S8 family serine peptidase n=1 Tax=Belliella alkalica TaxID=1730871 RepID=A0ABS9V732_9BACT|nr:S8 family serine peptidase [Belliella alkalica]MCH7412229.1 S8 family serine peptidase [Belliella alkalica]
MGKIRFLFSIFFALVFHFSNGQGKYAVHYKYKPQDQFSLEDGTGFLTTKSLERRVKQSIPLDSLDLPISKKYEAQILENSMELIYNTKWMNASLVIASQDQVDVISGFDFVEKVEFVSPISNNGGRIHRRDKRANIQNLELKNVSRKSSNEVYDFQNSLLGIQQMHEEGFTGKGVTIAVFDGGFLGVDKIDGFKHLFENNQIVATRDFINLRNADVYTRHQHGTNVLSLIGANMPQLLVSGAPDASYILCITEDVFSEYRIEEYNWLKAAEFADSLGVDIINSSLGYLDFDDPRMDYFAEDLDGATAVISQAAFIAGQKGILVVNSVGNYGSRGGQSITAPADAKGILSIGAVDIEFKRANFSSQGPNALGDLKPELVTFGRGAFLIRSNGTVSPGNGTSFSAPQITALAAGLWQAKPDWTKNQLIDALIKSGSQAENPDNELGYGIPDFARAYYGEILSVEEKGEVEDWKIYPNPNEGQELFINFGLSNQIAIRLFDVNGSVILDSEISRDSNNNPFTVSLPTLVKGVYLLELQSGRDVKRTKLIKR